MSTRTLVACLSVAGLLSATQAFASDKQWTVITITTNADITLKNFNCRDGKYHQNGNKDQTLSNDNLENTKILKDGMGKISACGRSGGAEGVAGFFEIWDGRTKVGTDRFSSPYRGDNFATFEKATNKYAVEITRDNTSNSSALRGVSVEVTKK